MRLSFDENLFCLDRMDRKLRRKLWAFGCFVVGFLNENSLIFGCFGRNKGFGSFGFLFDLLMGGLNGMILN